MLTIPWEFQQLSSDETGPCHELGLSTGEDIRSQLLEVGDDGPALRADGDPRADAIRAQLGSKVISHGKLIMRRRLEEIAEYDGTNGMPTWVRIGTGVYDLSGACPPFYTHQRQSPPPPPWQAQGRD